jgi:hypothetical protein
MVKTWNTVFATQGPAGGIPPEHTSQLVFDAQAAEALLDKVKNGERTPADAVQCSLVFKDTETGARFIKRHYLLMPPLTPTDFASLLLPLPDETYTPVGPCFLIAAQSSYTAWFSEAHRSTGPIRRKSAT